MLCTNCFNLCNGVLGGTLPLGAIDASEGTEVYLYVQHIGSNRTEQFSVEVEADGDVTLDLDDDFFQDGESYRVWVVSDAYTWDDYEISPTGTETTAPCVNFKIMQVC